jgi:hypothetical protein
MNHVLENLELEVIIPIVEGMLVFINFIRVEKLAFFIARIAQHNKFFDCQKWATSQRET